jgi:hypothetical protein
MYQSPCRQQGLWAVGRRARHVPADYHDGDRREFMRRHDEESGQLSSAPRRQRREFARCFLTRIADARNLNAAVEHLCRDGDKSPGPNGICLRSLDDRERWQLCRALGQAILDGSYRPGPTRTVRIPKSSGSGTRQLTLHNAEDVVVHRAVVQILQPFLDPQFSEKSFGFRPGLGPEDALLAAAKIAEGQERWSWVTEDIADAFGSVPHVRLLESLHAHDLGEDVIALIARIIGTSTPAHPGWIHTQGRVREVDPQSHHVEHHLARIRAEATKWSVSGEHCS